MVRNGPIEVYRDKKGDRIEIRWSRIGADTQHRRAGLRLLVDGQPPTHFVAFVGIDIEGDRLRVGFEGIGELPEELGHHLALRVCEIGDVLPADGDLAAEEWDAYGG